MNQAAQHQPKNPDKKTEQEKQESKRKPLVRRWVSDQYLADYYGVSRCTIWRWCKPEIGRLPPPEKIGENCTRWDFQKINKAELPA